MLEILTRAVHQYLRLKHLSVLPHSRLSTGQMRQMVCYRRSTFKRLEIGSSVMRCLTNSSKYREIVLACRAEKRLIGGGFQAEG